MIKTRLNKYHNISEIVYPYIGISNGTVILFESNDGKGVVLHSEKDVYDIGYIDKWNTVHFEPFDGQVILENKK